MPRALERHTSGDEVTTSGKSFWLIKPPLDGPDLKKYDVYPILMHIKEDLVVHEASRLNRTLSQTLIDHALREARNRGESYFFSIRGWYNQNPREFSLRMDCKRERKGDADDEKKKPFFEADPVKTYPPDWDLNGDVLAWASERTKQAVKKQRENESKPKALPEEVRELIKKHGRRAVRAALDRAREKLEA